MMRICGLIDLATIDVPQIPLPHRWDDNGLNFRQVFDDFQAIGTHASDQQRLIGWMHVIHAGHGPSVRLSSAHLEIFAAEDDFRAQVDHGLDLIGLDTSGMTMTARTPKVCAA